MAYKLLLFGNNTSVIEDIYTHSNIKIEVMTSSSRFDDLVTHAKYYNPHAIVYCMHNEPVGMYKIVTAFKKEKLRREVPVIIVGSPAACEEFERACPHLADITLVRPITGRTIITTIIEYFEKQELSADEPDEILEDEELPVKSGPVRDAASDQALLDKLAEELLDSPERKHILVIDDDPRMLKVIKRHLENEYEVATAVNGKVALKFLQTKSADLILLDYEMPVQDGPTVLNKLRENPKTKDIPVVFLTGINDRDKIRTALSMRPQGYLLKPIDRKKLMETIYGILG